MKIKYQCSNRKKETTISRLRYGKTRLEQQLHKIKKHADGLCESCGVQETVEHYLLHCTASTTAETIQESCIRNKISYSIEAVLANHNVKTIYTR